MTAPTEVPDDPALDRWLSAATREADDAIDLRIDAHLRELAEGREELREGPLFDVVDDVSQWIEAAVDARMRELPPVAIAPRRSHRPYRARRVVAALAVGLAAAAAIVIAIALPSLRGDEAVAEPTAPTEQAAAAVEVDDDGASARMREAEPAPPKPANVVEPEATTAELAPEPEPEPEPASPRGKKPHLGDRVLELDAQAQARWRAGDLAGARKLFAEIVRIAGKSSHAQTAYGELFTLAHQQGDASGQRKLWRAYVRTFPRGRHADDARAGLCRTAAADERAPCWQLYLRDFPRGTYREVAEREVASGASEP